MSSSHDRYGSDVLASDWRAPKKGRAREIVADLGLVVEEVSTDWCGEIVQVDRDLRTVTLEDRRNRRRTFPLGPGFHLEGLPVVLVAPVTQRMPDKATRTASGSIAVAGVKARVARASRIYVEGRHDAELVEKVWGDDLRIEGVVVERLDGIDHLVPGSKESRIADAVRRGPAGEHVLIVGHPFIDIWAAVKPQRLGKDAWPTVPRTVDWKHGVCQAWGWPHRDQADIARAWKHILGGVRGFQDLDPTLLGRVEELIDFVTA